MVAEDLKLVVEVQTANAIRNMNQFKQSVTQGTTTTNKMLGSLKTLAIGFGAAYLGAQGLSRALRAAFDAAQYAAKFKAIEGAFTTMADGFGENADRIVADMKKVSQGTISDMDIITAASRAALFDIPMDKLDDLMQIATASATATGESVKYMFDSIVTGIARGSPLILDNLGLTLKIGAAVDSYAASLGKTAEQLTADERKQAVLNATLEAGTKLVNKLGDSVTKLTAQKQYEIMQANFQNLRKEVGLWLLPAFQSVTKVASDFAKKMAEIIELRNIMRAVAEGTASAEDQVKLLDDRIAKMQATMKQGANINIMGAGFNDQRKLDALMAQREALLRQAAALAQAESMRGAATKKAAQDAADAAARQAKAASDLAKYLDDVDKAYGATKVGQKAALESAIAYWEDSLKTAVKTKPQVIAILAELREQLAEMNAVEAAQLPLREQQVALLKELNQGSVTYRSELQLAAEEQQRVNESIEKYLELERQHKAEIPAVVELLKQMNQNYTYMKVVVPEATARLSEFADVAERLEYIFKSGFSDAFTAMGEALASGEDAWAAFGEAAKETIARVLEALGQKALAMAVEAFAEGFTNPVMFAAAAAWGAAAAAAFTAAGVVRALGEGGIVTKPTMALVGERGPEAVIPLNRAGGMGTIIVNVQGSLMEEEGLVRRITEVQKRYARGY